MKEFVTEGDPDEYERPEQTDISSDYRQKAKNKVQIGDQKHLTVLKGQLGLLLLYNLQQMNVSTPPFRRSREEYEHGAKQCAAVDTVCNQTCSNHLKKVHVCK